VINVAGFYISVYQICGRFLFVVDILWNYDMSNAWFQKSSDSKLWHDEGICIFMNSDFYCFRNS